MSDLYLSVVVPVFNEEKMIRETVRRIAAYFGFAGCLGEILVVDDGSTDRTSVILRGIQSEKGPGHEFLRVLTSEKNSGKGFAARRGMLEARGRYALMTDADLSTPMKEVEKLSDALAAGADVAIGSRAIRKSGCDVRQSFKRRLSGRIFNGFVQAAILPGLRDTQCGFKLFTRQAARELFSRQTLLGFSFDVEILYLARSLGMRIAEVPVMWSEGASSHVNLLRDSTRMVRDLWTIKRTHYWVKAQ